MRYLNFYAIKKLQDEKEVFNYFLQNLQDTIATWSYFVNWQKDKINRRFDFAILINQKLFIFEANFYSGGGTKLKSTAGEYKVLHNFLKKRNVAFVWITDGYGWNSNKKALEETFYNNDYIFNIKMLSENILKEFLNLNSS